MPELAVDPHKLEELLNYCTEFAKQMLSSHGEFHPFGATLSPSGEIGAVGASNGEEFPPGAELAQVLIDAFREQFESGKIIAAALAANVDIPSQFESGFADGVRVTMECKEYSRHFYLPYRCPQQGILGRLSRKTPEICYGELFSVEVEPFMTKTKG